jgi:chromosome segregation ATPase
MSQELKQRIAEVQARMNAVDDNVEELLSKTTRAEEDAVKRCEEMESKCNEVWQHIDHFQNHLKQVDSDLKDIKTTVIVLMKLLNNFIDHKE